MSNLTLTAYISNCVNTIPLIPLIPLYPCQASLPYTCCIFGNPCNNINELDPRARNHTTLIPNASDHWPQRVKPSTPVALFF
jgi:hypothetical protein